MLLSIGVADAYGIGWEFVKDPEAHGLVNDLQTFQSHPRYGPAGELVPSQYTDDTLRSIATALVVINNKKDGTSIFDPCSYVKAIQLVVSQDRRKGWSKRFQSYLEANLDVPPIEFMRGIENKASSNGSIMGCLPLGYLPNIQDVKLAATVQAITTHAAETAQYAQAMALAAHFFIHDLGGPSQLLWFLSKHLTGSFSAEIIHYDEDDYFGDYERGPGEVNMSAYSTAQAVLWLLINHDSLSELLKAAVDLGGDTDSVAALAVGIASCTNRYKHDLPARLVNELDNGRGKHYLMSLDRQLKAAGER